jgi:hypothetical protein
MKRSLCLAVPLIVLLHVVLHAQGKAEHKFKNCHQAYKLVDKSWDDDTMLLASARDYLTHCSAEVTAQQRARLLSRMGRALVHMRKFSESFPILEECADIAVKNGLSGDFTSCMAGHGIAAANQGQCDLAKIAFQSVLEVATTDNLTSENHDLAESWMDLLHEAANTGTLRLPSLTAPYACCSSQIRCQSAPVDKK